MIWAQVLCPAGLSTWASESQLFLFLSFSYLCLLFAIRLRCKGSIIFVPLIASVWILSIFVSISGSDYSLHSLVWWQKNCEGMVYVNYFSKNYPISISTATTLVKVHIISHQAFCNNNHNCFVCLRVSPSFTVCPHPLQQCFLIYKFSGVTKLRNLQ